MEVIGGQDMHTSEFLKTTKGETIMKRQFQHDQIIRRAMKELAKKKAEVKANNKEKGKEYYV